MPICGFSKSASVKPTACSMARAGALLETVDDDRRVAAFVGGHVYLLLTFC